MKHARQNRWANKVLAFCFVVYGLVLGAYLFGKASGMRRISLIPLATIMDFLRPGRVLVLSNLLGNLLLLTPMGMFFAMRHPERRAATLGWWLLLCSVGIEAVQYLLCTGVADIDDVLLNTLGGIAGVGVFRLIERLLGDRTKPVLAIASLWMCAACVFLLFALETGLFGIKIHVLHG